MAGSEFAKFQEVGGRSELNIDKVVLAKIALMSLQSGMPINHFVNIALAEYVESPAYQAAEDNAREMARLVIDNVTRDMEPPAVPDITAHED